MEPQRKTKKIVQIFYYLKKTGQIKINAEKNELEIQLTEKGKKNLDKINFQTLSIPKQKNGTADGGW